MLAIHADVVEQFEKNISTGKGWIWERLRWLLEEKQLDLEQLYWYWNKYDKLLDKHLSKTPSK